MPVTARLSKRFYDTFGDENTNELVDWFNAVDAEYRNGLREMNEQNFARFDRTLRETLAAFEAKLDAKLEAGLAGIRTELHAFKAELIKWMFLFWAGTALAGLLFR